MFCSVSITFIQSNGIKKKVDAKFGSSLMETGIENDVGIVGKRLLNGNYILTRNVCK